jgi:serine/threonine protein kinase
VTDAEKLPFYVMPRFASTLRGYFKNDTHSPQSRLDILLKVLKGVEAAHLLGVAHRDLKPENILLSSNASDVVIADFGIAAFIEADMATAVETKKTTRLANFMYAAPEQLEHGTPGDKRSDTFALGLIINEAFTGRLARGTDYQRIGEIAPDFGYLDGIVESMIRQDPSKRIGSVGQVKEEIASAGRVAVARQKVDAISREVVPETELDDPLVRRPPTLHVSDWSDDTLFFELRPPVNQEWKSAFLNNGYRSMYMGSAPQDARWNGNKGFAVPARGDAVGDVRSHYEQHIADTNQKYAQYAAQAHAQRLREERAARDQMREREATRLRVLESLKR